MKFLEECLSVFFPETCWCCNAPISKNSKKICLSCRHELPFTNYTNHKGNKVEKSFYGRIPLEAATALLHFQKQGPVQALMHQLKYRGHQNIGTQLGFWLAKSMNKSTRFNTIDCIVPVPLHKKRFKKRGYNQLTTFGETLSKTLNIPYINDNLIRVKATSTQTKKFRVERWSNVSTKFHVKNPETFENKHVLLIDDIITTGATVEACFNAFKSVQHFKMSLATMSYTS